MFVNQIYMWNLFTMESILFNVIILKVYLRFENNIFEHNNEEYINENNNFEHNTIFCILFIY